jgi:glycosyltransferase involved in cell wall biosynthesis
MTRPRLVIMANNIDEVGGAQRVVHVVAQGLAERGYPVDLVGVTPFEPRHQFVADPAFRRFVLMSQAWPPPPSGRGVRARLRRSNRERRAMRPRLRAEAIGRLRQVLADGPAGIVVTSQLWAMEHLAEVPHADWAVIGQYHSSFQAAAAGRDLPRALALYRDVDTFTLLTEADADAFRREGLNNTSWLANPLAFWPRQSATGSGRDGGVVTYLGRLSAEKGVGYLVDAWGRIADAHPNWRLRLVGSGPDERAIRKAVATLPAGGDRVELVGPVLDSEAELRSSDLLVLPSLTEGLPLVLAEAMATGLACLATDCSAGVRLLADDGAAARLVPRGDSAALAQGMAALMSAPEDRAALGARARTRMADYRAEVILDQWEQLIADVLR